MTKASQLDRDIAEALRGSSGLAQEEASQTPQAGLKARLEGLGLPFKDIEVYGSQIVVTSHSRRMAERWARFLAQIARVRGITDSLDYAKKQRGTVLVPTVTKVFRTFAAIR